jgi:hypothetical protein
MPYRPHVNAGRKSLTALRGLGIPPNLENGAAAGNGRRPASSASSRRANDRPGPHWRHPGFEPRAGTTAQPPGAADTAHTRDRRPGQHRSPPRGRPTGRLNCEPWEQPHGRAHARPSGSHRLRVQIAIMVVASASLALAASFTHVHDSRERYSRHQTGGWLLPLAVDVVLDAHVRCTGLAMADDKAAHRQSARMHGSGSGSCAAVSVTASMAATAGGTKPTRLIDRRRRVGADEPADLRRWASLGPGCRRARSPAASRPFRWR